jgi:heme-degrading monooxygenase HmoA
VQVPAAKRERFERSFNEHATRLREAEGFVDLELLRGTEKSAGEYVVVTRWEDESAFRAWLESGILALDAREVDVELAAASEVHHYEVLAAVTMA